MRLLNVVIGILSFIVAALVLVYAEAPRKFYSGFLFAMLGVVMILSARRRKGDSERK